ncbi:uncharacterized protein DS421_5g141090 [Arachis hypogaea]|nr:uncharacterized protein DS421_5g141090 [Arachis hypogaea]
MRFGVRLRAPVRLRARVRRRTRFGVRLRAMTGSRSFFCFVRLGLRPKCYRNR